MRPIVFDMDGVLVDSEELSWSSWAEVLAPYGVEVTAEDREALTGRTAEACHAAFGERANLPPYEEFAKQVADVVHAVLESRLQAFEDAVDTLEMLSGRVPMAVASSSSRERLDVSLAATGLAGLFEVTVAGDEVTEGKPSPDLYLAAAERLGVPASDCLAVEDAPVGVAAGVAAGMTVVAVARGAFTDEALREAGADVVVPRLTPAVLMR